MKQNWFRISHAVFDDPRFMMLPPTAQFFYVYLVKLRNRSNGRLRDYPGWLQFTDEELAARMYCSGKTILRSRRLLQMNGFLEYQTTKNRKACRYYIHDVPVRDTSGTVKMSVPEL